METYQYLIIGGGLAGALAAANLRKVDAEGSLLLITAEPHLPYSRPPLSKAYLQGKKERQKVFYKSETFYRENDIEVAQGVMATGLDPDGRTVTLDDGRRLQYDKLLLATGGSARRLPLPGSDLEHVFTLRTLEDSDHIREASGRGRRAVVMGGSFIGAEVSMSLAELGTRVTLIFPESRLMERIMPPAMSDYLRDMYTAHGVHLLPGTVAERLEGDGKLERVVLDNGQTLEADLCVMGVGIELNTDLARQAGLDLNDEGAVLVDEYLRTGDPNIYAAGDIAAWNDLTFQRRLRVEHWDVARNTGARAGRNMAGEEEPYTELPYFFSDMFDLSLEVWGNLDRWDETVKRGSLDEGSFAFYYFDEGQLTGVLAVERPDDERAPMQDLVRQRPMATDVAAALADPAVNLDSLLD
jgi:3-phenylpropionate/trans-cinnamate dioxygenase ferredoxin reductase component